MLQVEEDMDGHTNHEISGYCSSRISQVEPSVAIYHMKYLIAAGMIEAQNGYIVDLRPEGHEFTNSTRNSEIWEKTKKKIKPLGTVSIAVISQVASAFAKSFLGLP